MTRVDRERLELLVTSAFTRSELRHLLQYRLEIDLRDDGAPVGLRETARRAVEAITRQGVLPQFLAEVAQARPNRPDLQAAYHQAATALVGEVKRRPADAAVVAAYTRLGLAPPLVAQRAGAEARAVPVTVGDLECLVRTALGREPRPWLEALFRLEGRVCRVELRDAPAVTGTGLLVGPQAVLTSYRALQRAIEETHTAAGVMFRFDYKRMPGGSGGGTVAGLASPEGPAGWLLDHGAPAGPELGYAVVRLARPLGAEPVGAGGPNRGWVELPAAPPAPAGLPALLILQHPGRGPLEVVLDTSPNAELTHGGVRLRYATRTEEGSSGAPCFDPDWGLVAMHHDDQPAGQGRHSQGVPVGWLRGRLRGAARAALGGPCP